MRFSTGLTTALALWALSSAPLTLTARAETATPAASAAEPAAPACASRRGVLGVSRVVEIDATDGPRLGNMQYREIDFLKPGEVVLTFDDGPLRTQTLAVLNALERHCTKATFFMVGRMAVTDPVMVREIDRRGHTVATHTWSHRNLKAISKAAAEKEIELGISAISAALGRPVAPFFRFPYLSDPASMIAHLKSRDNAIFSIDVDSLDFRTRSGDVMKNRILAGLERQGKGILLFHDIQRSTAAGLDDLLDELARRNFKIVHIVSKHPVKTLPEYDEMARQEMAKRAKMAERPLASRSIVWPVTTGEMPPSEPADLKPRGQFEAPLPERPARDGAQLRGSSTEAEAPAAARSSTAGDDQDDWRRKIFTN